jgi:hypothetical protein
MKETCEAVYRSRAEYLEKENLRLQKENNMLNSKLFKKSFQFRLKEFCQRDSIEIQRGSVIGWLWTFVMFIPIFLISPIIYGTTVFGSRLNSGRNFAYALFIFVFIVDIIIILLFKGVCLGNSIAYKVFFASSGLFFCVMWIFLCLSSHFEATVNGSFSIPFIVDKKCNDFDEKDK